MLKTIVETNQAPQAIGPYVQAVVVGPFVYTSGQIGLGPKTSTLEDTFEKQAHKIFDNLDAILHEAGSNLSLLVKLTVYLTHMENYSTLNKIMTERLTAPHPARTTIVVSALPMQALVEIEAIAVKKEI